MRLPHLFVVPPASALPTGGNIYNEGLLAALTALGRAHVRCTIDALSAHAESASNFARVWVDSLYLGQLPEHRATLAQFERRGLLLHALPSTLARAAGQAHEALRARERSVLATFDCALVTSTTTAQELSSCASHLRTWLLEPAIRRAPDGLRGPGDGTLRALMVANLTPNKGVLLFLGALASRVRESDAFMLRVVGRFDLDLPYGEACRRALTEQPLLAARVELAGVRSEAQVLGELAEAHVLISASRVESFGMAIADARGSGCVVLAHPGGHVGRLVDRDAGGSVVADDAALADVFLACVRDRAALLERLEKAAARRLAQRTWGDVARAFLAYADAQHGTRKAQ
jgi:glycosyltransferase involved in cell wall biosynthesis